MERFVKKVASLHSTVGIVGVDFPKNQRTPRYPCSKPFPQFEEEFRS